jgi:hypothetical protein
MRGLLAALLASCATPGAQRAESSDEGAPAVIVEPTPQSRAALLQAVTDLLNGAQPLLAGDALTRESTLIVERRHLEGRDRGTPERFVLRKVGTQCVLVHEKSGKRAVLVETKCAQAPAAK